MKYRPPLSLSQPLDRTCEDEIDVAYNGRQRRSSSSSSRDWPCAFRPSRRRAVAAFVRQAPTIRARGAAQKVNCSKNSGRREVGVRAALAPRRRCQPERSDGQGRVPVAVAVPRSAVLRISSPQGSVYLLQLQPQPRLADRRGRSRQ